jgi:hypothetical protein
MEVGDGGDGMGEGVGEGEEREVGEKWGGGSGREWD